MSAIDQLREILDRRIAIHDGSWGVLIHRRGLSEAEYRGERLRDHGRDVKGNPDLLNLTRPDIVTEIHDAYFDAGADLATTNTFTATSIGQADYALEGLAAEMSREGARLARAAADAWTRRTPERPRFVAGAIGPLNVSLSVSPKVEDASYRSVTFAQVRETYAEQIAALAEGGVDVLLVETIFDTLNAKAAIVAAADVAPELPLWLSFTAIDKSGRNLSGQTSEAFWVSVEHAAPLIVGVNCALGATEMRPFLEDLSACRGHLRRVLSERRPARTRWASTTSSRATRAGSSARSPRTASSTSSAAAAGRRPSTSARSPPPSRASRRGRSPPTGPARAGAGSSRSRSAPTPGS